MTNLEKINEFLNAGPWMLLTTDGEQPKGRPFRFHLLQNDTMYFGTGTHKNVYTQMLENPHVEVLALKDGEFLRYDGDVVWEETDDISKAVLESLPNLKKVYEANGHTLRIFHLENAKAEIRNMSGLVEELYF